MDLQPPTHVCVVEQTPIPMQSLVVRHSTQVCAAMSQTPLVQSEVLRHCTQTSAVVSQTPLAHGRTAEHAAEHVWDAVSQIWGSLQSVATTHCTHVPVAPSHTFWL